MAWELYYVVDENADPALFDEYDGTVVFETDDDNKALTMLRETYGRIQADGDGEWLSVCAYNTETGEEMLF